MIRDNAKIYISKVFIAGILFYFSNIFIVKAQINFDQSASNKKLFFGIETNPAISIPKTSIINTESIPGKEEIDFIKNNLLITFNPVNMTLIAVNNFKNCNNPEIGGHPVLHKNRFSNDLKEECQPDTVYSWGSLEKAEKLFNELKNSKDWNKIFSKPVYASFLPASTFPYGPVPIRFKLKQGLTYEHSQTCPSKFSEKNSNTVYYAIKSYSWFPGGKSFIDIAYEILLCSPSVIESVSYGYEEHYDEVVREILWRTTPGRKPEEYYSYFHGGVWKIKWCQAYA